MTARLLRDETAHHLATLQQRSTLTALQSARLAAILDTLADDGRFLLRAALDAAEFPAGDARGQDAFQDFRKRVNQVAAEAGVDLRLELDSRKAPPDQRHGWFTGGDLVDQGIASFTGEAAGRTGIDHPVTPEVAELGLSRRTRVYVSAHPTDKAQLGRWTCCCGSCARRWPWWTVSDRGRLPTRARSGWERIPRRRATGSAPRPTSGWRWSAPLTSQLPRLSVVGRWTRPAGSSRSR